MCEAPPNWLKIAMPQPTPAPRSPLGAITNTMAPRDLADCATDALGALQLKVRQLEELLKLQNHKLQATQKVCLSFDLIAHFVNQWIAKHKASPRITPGPRTYQNVSNIKKPRAADELKPWSQLEPRYQQKLMENIILPALRAIRDCAGSPAECSKVFGAVLCSHTLNRRSQSVTDSECIFDDGMAVIRAASALWQDLCKEMRDAMRNSISPYEFMILCDVHGISNLAQIALRQSYDRLFHSSRQVTDERNKELAMAERLMGSPTELFDANGDRLGFELSIRTVAQKLAQRALAYQLQPVDAALDYDGMEKNMREQVITELFNLREKEGSAVFVKKEAQLANVAKEIKAARRRCASRGWNCTPEKEACLGALIHRQFLQALDVISVWLKIGIDGRVLLRQLTSSKHSNQCAAFVNLVNDGSRVQSVESIFGFQFTIGGETAAFPAIDLMMKELADLRDNGMVLGANGERSEMVRLALGDDFVLVSNIRLAFKFTITADGALKFKICNGPCGAASHTPCPECECIANQHEGKYNIQFAAIKIEVQRGDTPRKIASEQGIDVRTLIWMNTPSLQAKMQEVTGKGCDSCEEDHFKPWSGFHKLGPDEPIAAPGRSRLFIRGRFTWESNRPLVPEVARHGFGWDDIVFCTCHEPMRDIEWFLYCLWGYGIRTEDEASDWLVKRGMSIKVETDGEKLRKPKINHGSCAKKWFQPDPLEPSKPLWETACEFFDDPKRLGETKKVWLSYEKLNTVIPTRINGSCLLHSVLITFSHSPCGTIPRTSAITYTKYMLTVLRSS